MFISPLPLLPTLSLTLTLLSLLTALPSTTATTSTSTPTPPTLSARAGIAPAAGVIPLPSPTQMSPATIYLVRGPDGNPTPMAYTQTFVATPDPWPAPTPGSVGLGTIQGVVGVVRTESKVKRGAVPTGVGGARFMRFAQGILGGGGGGDGYGDRDGGEGGVPVEIKKGGGRGGARGGHKGGSSAHNGAGTTRVQAWTVGVAFAVAGFGAVVVL